MAAKDVHRIIKKAKVSAEKPLVAAVYVPIRTEQAASWRHVAAFAEKLVRWIPTYRATRGGKRGKRTVQALLGLLGLGIAGVGKTWIFAIAGVVVAALAMVLPVPRSRRALWVEQLKKNQVPTSIIVWSPGELVWDGVKITVRYQGKVLRSVRPVEMGYMKVLPERGEVFELHRVGGSDKDRWFFQVVSDQHWNQPGIRYRLVDQQEGIGIRRQDWEVLETSIGC
ncbi:MAG: hypothetical protein HUU55_21260 [Myxococcales bacterium]|nr:hypothetical protein [Myxococcales bacterium]